MIAEAFSWWLVIEIVGLLALPVVFSFCSGLPGRGYAFTKPIGLLLIGYGFWLALSLHLLPNRPGSVVWIALVIIVVDAWLLRKRWQELRAAVEERIGLIIAVEIVFTLGFFVAAHLRSFIPEIAGTEKPMDFMLLNTAARSRYYPPDDPWLSGGHVSYYYFGYVIQSIIAKLAAVRTAVAFNLAVASTAALIGACAFGLGYELMALARRSTFKLAVGAGVAAVVLVSVMGNLEGAVEFGVANDTDIPRSVINRIDIPDLDTAKQSDACLISWPAHCIEYPNEKSSVWWWWRATRMSPDAIEEFPFFSFILGDLHPHYMALPFVLTVAGLGLALWRWDTPLSFEVWRRRPAFLLFVAIALGALAFLNAWDLPTFAFVASLFVLARNLASASGVISKSSGLPGATRFAAVQDVLKETAGFLAPLGVASILLYLPFYLSFSSQAAGIDTVREGASRPLHSFLFWAPMMAATLPLPFYLLARDSKALSPKRLLLVSYLPLALLLAWVLLTLGDHGGGALSDALRARGWNWLTSAVFAAGLCATLLALWRAFERRDDDAAEPVLVPVLGLMALGLLLILGSELFYIRDVFESRLNTVFKLYYQAWPLLGVAGGFALVWLWQHAEVRVILPGITTRRVWAAAVAVLVGFALLYPLGATLSRTEGLARPKRTLDGLAYLKTARPDDYAAAQWLSLNAGRGERVIEAVGAPYSDAGRISVWTGLPTVLGWPGHEFQWGRDEQTLAERTRDVDLVYATPSMAEALSILRKYGVTYVVVGSIERANYPPEGLTKFDSGLPIVMGSGGTSIYRVYAEDSPLAREAP
ncbi:MAG TPA: DUF2298 domain-containing protein [Dehalococcoidia bacterium]|nr:DUF2298 domain-containing protein [Dehalococcoidia bacterium]